MSKHNTLKDSAPCYDCFQTMKDMGVKTIVYSTSSGAVVKSRLLDYVPHTYSLGRKFIINDYVELSRKELYDSKFDLDNPLDDFMKMEREREERDIHNLSLASDPGPGSTTTPSTSCCDSECNCADSHSDTSSEYMWKDVDYSYLQKNKLVHVIKRKLIKKRTLTIYFDSETMTKKACFI